MRTYNRRLKGRARELRSNQTESEARLWQSLRRKQVLGVQFYRQKPIGEYIVDFYAPAVGLVVEVDGSQHFEPDQERRDQARTSFLESQGLQVLRFSNLEVLQKLDSVTEHIYEVVKAVKESLSLEKRM